MYRRRVSELLEVVRAWRRRRKPLTSSWSLLITGNVAAVVLESIPEIGQAYPAWFRGLEAFSIAVFTVEYVSAGVVGDRAELSAATNARCGVACATSPTPDGGDRPARRSCRSI